MADNIRGIFVGLPSEEIIEIRNKAISLFKQGKTIMSYGDGVTQASKQFVMPPADVLAECRYALDKLNGTRVRGLFNNYNRTFDK